MMNKQKQNQVMLVARKSLITGAICSATSVAVLGRGGVVTIPMMNRTAPLWLVAYGLGALGSVGADIGHILVKKEIHVSKKAQDEASLLLGAVASAFLYKEGMRLVNPALPGEFGSNLALAIGASSELAGAFVSNMMN